MSPLHQEFHFPLLYSIPIVSNAGHRLSRCILQMTYWDAYGPFTPSDSGQRLHPSYYRGCWHEVSRCFLVRYRQIPTLLVAGLFFPHDRPLHSEELHQSRGVAASGFPPLRKIPHCCLPQESGPCLSASVADRPLRPATRRRPGEPSPHRLADGTRPPPRAPELSTPIP